MDQVGCPSNRNLVDENRSDAGNQDGGQNMVSKFFDFLCLSQLTASPFASALRLKLGSRYR